MFSPANLSATGTLSHYNPFTFRVVDEWWAIPDALLIKAGYQGTYSQERIDRMMAHNGERFENES